MSQFSMKDYTEEELVANLINALNESFVFDFWVNGKCYREPKFKTLKEFYASAKHVNNLDFKDSLYQHIICCSLIKDSKYELIDNILKPYIDDIMLIFSHVCNETLKEGLKDIKFSKDIHRMSIHINGYDFLYDYYGTHTTEYMCQSFSEFCYKDFVTELIATYKSYSKKIPGLNNPKNLLKSINDTFNEILDLEKTIPLLIEQSIKDDEFDLPKNAKNKNARKAKLLEQIKALQKEIEEC